MMDPQCSRRRARPAASRATESADQGVRLSIIDNGPGHARRRVLARISFEALFTTKTSGIGLGMPIVQQLVEMHFGRSPSTVRPARARQSGSGCRTAGARAQIAEAQLPSIAA